jgi:adenosylmethionine-8-amino-7-oxononanoate aminotransferase
MATGRLHSRGRSAAASGCIRHGLAHEALLRPIGNVVYFMPPYVIEREEIDTLIATARDGIRSATCA